MPDEWIEKALHLEVPYDNRRRLHFQHEGFEEGKITSKDLQTTNDIVDGIYSLMVYNTMKMIVILPVQIPTLQH